MTDTQNPRSAHPASTTEMWDDVRKALLYDYIVPVDERYIFVEMLDSLRTRMDDLQCDYDFDTHALQDQLAVVRAIAVQAEQERDEARARVKWFETHFAGASVAIHAQNLEAKLTKAEAVIEAARRLSEAAPYSLQATGLRGELRNALAAFAVASIVRLDQEEEAHGSDSAPEGER